MNLLTYVSASFLCVAGCNTVSDAAPGETAPGQGPQAPLVQQHARPPQAVVGAPRAIVAGQRACLHEDASYHPMAMPYITSWTQVAGEPVVLDTHDCFVAPAAGWTLGFTLTADDATMHSYDTLLLRVVTSSARLTF